MAETGKWVEVRYGAFACRVEGYDDPVEQMRGILAAMQEAIAETPALVEKAGRLDEGQFDRIRAALAERNGGVVAATPGLVVIRNAEKEADGGRSETLGGTPEAPEPSQAGPHPAGAIFAAPAAAAAAAAEAAFAAGIAAEEDIPAEEDDPSQAPLGAEEPDEPASAAAIFAAPAPEVPATPPGADAAEPADSDDDAGDAEFRSAEEAADDRAQCAQAEQKTLSRNAGAVRDATGWSASALGEDAASRDVPGRDGRPAGAAESEESLINIFAPPAADDAMRRAAESDASVVPAPEPLASLRREPGPAAADFDRVPGEWRDEHAIDEHDQAHPDEALDAAEWCEPDRGPGDQGYAPTAENRFASLITRYQNARQKMGTTDSARVGPETDISAGELAERAGAEDVADLLAASAAWLTLAAGRPRFSRREVMEVFETLPGDHPRTLEARIKGFGKLVRSGALVLVDEGTFAISKAAGDDFRALVSQR